MNFKLTAAISVANSLLLIGLAIFLFAKPAAGTTKVVNLDKIFDNFEMTKETKKHGNDLVVAREKQLDSLYALLKTGSASNNPAVMTEILAQKDSLSAFQMRFQQEETGKIWARLSSYAKLFGEKNGYSLILNSKNDSQAVLYNNASDDVTAQFLFFANQKYAGVK